MDYSSGERPTTPLNSDLAAASRDPSGRRCCPNLGRCKRGTEAHKGRALRERARALVREYPRWSPLWANRAYTTTPIGTQVLHPTGAPRLLLEEESTGALDRPRDRPAIVQLSQ